MHKLYRVYRYALFLLDRFKYLDPARVRSSFVISTSILWCLPPRPGDPHTRKDLGEIAFGVFELMFASEPALPYPKGSVPAQVVFFVLPVLNILGLAAAVAQFSQILFDRGLYNRAQADNADGHVILCGLGRLGREVLKQLDRRHHMKQPARHRDRRERRRRRRARQRVPDQPRADHPGRARQHDPRRHAPRRGHRPAVAVMMLTGDDTTNLEAALLARELNPNVRVVLRMSNKRVTQRLDDDAPPQPDPQLPAHRLGRGLGPEVPRALPASPACTSDPVVLADPHARRPGQRRRPRHRLRAGPARVRDRAAAEGARADGRDRQRRARSTTPTSRSSRPTRPSPIIRGDMTRQARAAAGRRRPGGGGADHDAATTRRTSRPPCSCTS